MARSSPLTQLHRRHRQLARRLNQIGPILKGTVGVHYTRCGKANCRCQRDPPQLHGPYWQWSTAVDGKTVSRRLSDEEVTFYQECIENRKRLEALLTEMHNLSLQAAAQLKRQNAAPRRRSTG